MANKNGEILKDFNSRHVAHQKIDFSKIKKRHQCFLNLNIFSAI
jgi:hypothetical protein